MRDSMQEIIDLRSDTVTKPSRAMRRAMAEAEVGDDVFGEDPTVNRLQEAVASLFGKPAALFVPSGVMANQLAIKTQTNPGDEIIVEQSSHIFNYETAGPSLLSHVQMFPIKGQRGILKATMLAPAVRPSAYYMPRTTMVCLENTHNMAGGTIYPLEEIKSIYTFAKAIGLKLHLDGARIWNAWVATGIHPREYGQYFDTISVCFSKGLGAPVGSALIGSEETISRARKFRKVFGGGMRQAGILAAAALYALERNIKRLEEDHAKAKVFAEIVGSVPWIRIDRESVQTNIIVIDIEATGRPNADVLQECRHRGLLLTEAGFSALRAVMHMDVTMEQVRRAGRIVASVVTKEAYAGAK